MFSQKNLITVLSVFSPFLTLFYPYAPDNLPFSIIHITVYSVNSNNTLRHAQTECMLHHITLLLSGFLDFPFAPPTNKHLELADV